VGVIPPFFLSAPLVGVPTGENTELTLGAEVGEEEGEESRGGEGVPPPPPPPPVTEVEVALGVEAAPSPPPPCPPALRGGVGVATEFIDGVVEGVVTAAREGLWVFVEEEEGVERDLEGAGEREEVGETSELTLCNNTPPRLGLSDGVRDGVEDELLEPPPAWTTAPAGGVLLPHPLPLKEGELDWDTLDLRLLLDRVVNV